MTSLRLLRWTAGGLTFSAAALVFGQIASESRVAPVPSRFAARLATAEAQRYAAIAPTDREAVAALRFAVSDQQLKNRSAVRLVSVLSAERQIAAGTNLRFCIAVDRQGRADSARVVVNHSSRQRWLVTLWAWGACGRDQFPR